MRLWQAIGMMIGFVAVVLVVLFLWWDFDVRWRPHEIRKDQVQITRLLESAGWVSPGGAGGRVYVVAVRDCAPCERLAADDFPALAKAGIDTRVIMVAPADVNGKSAASPFERASVAELWVNRHWALYQAWMAANPAGWTAPGVPPADGDAARTAVVAASRGLVDKLTPLMRENGVRMAWPLAVWQARDGTLQAASGDVPKTWPHIRQDLAAQ